MKYHIKTYGCQMNVRDSDSVGATLSRRGWEAAGSESEADVIVVNTCSVRGKAEDKALGKLGLLVAGKREHPGLIVGAIGCMVQNLGASIFKRVPGLDFAIGTRRLWRVPAIVDVVAAGGGPVLETEGDDPRWEDLSGHAETGVSAFVNILFGCNRRCSYCVVPHVRGQEWSRLAPGILNEVRGLAEQGTREVTLLGQSVMSYGRTNPVWPEGWPSPGGYREPLARLLEAVAAIRGIERVRFTSGHPSGCSAELARAMAEVRGVCAHLHMPVQSGSDRILGLMRRGYTADGYRAAVGRLRAAVPGIGLTTDIIVGFPSETDEDFEATRRFMNEVAFDQAYIFKYSPRPGTPAAEMADDVPDEMKMSRNRVLLEDLDRTALRINGALVGKQVDVLVEGPSLRNESRWAGRTETNKIVIFNPTEALRVGDVAAVEIDRVMAQTLYGEVREIRPARGVMV